MIELNGKEYELFFSNNLSPLIALNYADELFFSEFKKLCGKRYRILSIIRKGWQNKYGLSKDIDRLRKEFELRIGNKNWADNLLATYDEKSAELRNLLALISVKNYGEVSDRDIINDLKEIRDKSVFLDAMSNMLHLFSSLVGYKFFENLSHYSEDREIVNTNFIYYTQPIRESRFAKITINKIKKEFKLSSKDKNFSQILRIGAFVKDDVSELLDARRETMKNLFKEASSRMNCSKEDIEYLQISEIENYLLKYNVDIKNLIVERKALTILYYPNKKLNIFEGNKAERFLKNTNFKKIFNKTKEFVLKGQIASLGKVKGVAKIVSNSNEAKKKIKKGDILVAPYTAVEYLSSMKKASGIITETGGVTSHAAIVSRELNIPCIVGLKEATKKIKDGQRIELNANEGIVRIL